MRLSRSVLDAYNAAVKQQGDNAEKATRKALNVWFSENPGASIADTREFCIALMGEIGTTFGNAAGDAAYALRGIVADAAGVELPDVDYAYEPDSEFVEKTARYQVEKLKGGDSVGFADSIADASRYFAERGANDTMAALGKVDSKRLGKKVRFARVPTGVTTCPYCLMLASRGFVYGSEVKALNANHRHCDCRIVEGFDGMTVEGYDPDEYYDMWKNPEKYANSEKPKTDENQEVSFDLNGVVASSNTKRMINKLKAEYESPVVSIQPMPPGSHYAIHGSTEAKTGLVIQLRKGDDVTTVHEYAHSMWYSKRLKEYQGEQFDEFKKELGKLWRQYKKDDRLATSININSYTNIDEFFAEAFSAYITGKNPDRTGNGVDSPYVKLVGELADKYFKKR